MLLLMSSFSIVNAKELNIKSSNDEEEFQLEVLDDTVQYDVFGIEYNTIQGNWEPYGDHAIRMSPGHGTCVATYKYNVTYCWGEIDPESFIFGIYFCDLAAYPWVEGPTVYIYDFHVDNWVLIEKECGNQDEVTWKWFEVDSSIQFVDDECYVQIGVTCGQNDDTILDMVGVRFTPIDCDSNLKAWVNDPITWVDVELNSQLTGTIKVRNVGDVGSKLDWEVSESLDWVTCAPDCGLDLAIGTTQTVKVVAKAPNRKGEKISGTISIFNSENPCDREVFNIKIETKKARCRSIFSNIFEKFPIFQRLLLF